MSDLTNTHAAIESFGIKLPKAVTDARDRAAELGRIVNDIRPAKAALDAELVQITTSGTDNLEDALLNAIQKAQPAERALLGEWYVGGNIQQELDRAQSQALRDAINDIGDAAKKTFDKAAATFTEAANKLPHWPTPDAIATRPGASDAFITARAAAKTLNAGEKLREAISKHGYRVSKTDRETAGREERLTRTASFANVKDLGNRYEGVPGYHSAALSAVDVGGSEEKIYPDIEKWIVILRAGGTIVWQTPAEQATTIREHARQRAEAKPLPRGYAEGVSQLWT